MVFLSRIASAVFLALLLLSACTHNNTSVATEMKDDEKTAVELLTWLDSADPESDAKKAVQKKQMHFYSMGQRGASLPGVPKDKSRQYQDACGYEVVPGATDAVRGDVHLKYLKLAREYAVVYNRVIAEHCGAK